MKLTVTLLILLEVLWQFNPYPANVEKIVSS